MEVFFVAKLCSATTQDATGARAVAQMELLCWPLQLLVESPLRTNSSWLHETPHRSA